MDRISDLPKDILQRILYFLSQEDAVRTSVLSKSWRYNWYTRPNLDFSYAYFYSEEQNFQPVVDKTLQRYCDDERLSLEEFHFCIFQDYTYIESVPLLNKWIPLLTTDMGLKKLCLSIDTRDDYTLGRIKLPRVVFGAESLQHLHLEGFELDQETIESILLCKHLRSLRLKKICSEGEILQKIISSYPLIETLEFGGKFQGTIKLNDLHNLKNLYLSFFSSRTEQLSSIEIYPPSLVETLSIDIRDCSICFNKEADFRNLKDLRLCRVGSSTIF